MHSIDPPSESFDTLFSHCVATTLAGRQPAYLAKLPDLVARCSLYNQKMATHTGHEIIPWVSGDVSPLTLKNFKNLYEGKLLSKDGPGRDVYNKLLLRGKQKGCCYCSYEDATELDHLLPHHRYAEFSIYPLNLIPSCHRCNRNKWTFWPTRQADNFIHPYFEDYSANQWLEARVDFLHGQPVIIYSVSHVGFTDSSIPKRIENEFIRLELPQRYSTQASREISARKVSTFQSLFNTGGRGYLVKWLTTEYNDQFQVDKNSWKTLAYKAHFRECRILRISLVKERKLLEGMLR